MRTRIVIYVVLVCLIYFPLAGQDFWQESAVELVELVDHPACNLWWVTLGYGSGGAIDQPSTLSAYLGFSFSPAKVPWLLTTVRFSYLMYCIDVGYFILCNGGYDVADISVLIGAIAKGKYAYASLSSGIGYTEVDYYEESYWEESYLTHIATMGLTFEFQAFLTPASWFGIGFISFANVNPERSFYGITGCMQFGRLRR
jgi:hypothetical protein